MIEPVDDRTALEKLQDNAHRKVKYIAAEHTDVAYAFFDVLAGGETVFSLNEWHDRVLPASMPDIYLFLAFNVLPYDLYQTGEEGHDSSSSRFVTHAGHDDA